MAIEELAQEPADGSEEMAADDIDGSFIPLSRAGVAGVEIDGEAVLLIEGTRTIHWLNQVGTIVWSSFDGSTVDEIAADLSEVFGADPEAVRSDVLELAGQLGRVGLLEGVAEEEIQPAHVQPQGLAPGSEIPPFRLPDLVGRPVSLEDLRGERLLLVNWSATCGYCDRIAPELAELQPELQEHGVRLVLLAGGGAEDNRRQLDGHGLKSTVLLQDEARAEVFSGLGTPVAYLVDEHGKAASELAIGALDVPVLARTAAGREREDAATPAG